MQNHAMSLAAEDFNVDLVGYAETQPAHRLLENEKIKITSLRAPPQFNNYLPKIISYALKAIWQSINLLFCLCCLSKPSYVLVQNPPSIPTLAIALLYCSVRRVKLLVDWHNYGFSIMALSLGNGHPLVKFSKWFERFFGSKAHHHLCVTNALKQDLNLNWGISECTTLYDMPPDVFQPISVEEKHHLFVKLSSQHLCFQHPSPHDHLSSSVFTEQSSDGTVNLRSERPALLVSSTSWTEDEDFSILLNALERYDESVTDTDRKLPKLLCVVTGKGPLKEYYKAEIEAKGFSNVEVCTPWLSAEDYPKLLASADLGVCLHTSSSGLDLPMKVVDMFGSGIPVCAVSYKCIDELVKHSENGMLFSNFEELTGQLQALFNGYPNNCHELLRLKSNVLSSRHTTWEEYWKDNALKLFA